MFLIYWQRFNNPDRIDTNSDDTSDQAHDVFGVIRAVGVGANARALVFRYLVLINNPFKRTPIAQTIFKRFRRDARERERVVHLERLPVL